MITVSIPYFRPINTNCIEGDYIGELELRGETVILDINFDNDWIDPHKLDPVKKMAGRLVTMDEKSRAYLYKDFKDPDGTIVRFYLQNLLENIWRPMLEKRVDFFDETITPIDQLFKCLHLDRVAFYPEKLDSIAKFEYCVDLRFDQLLITMHYDRQEELVEVLTEKTYQL